MLKPNQVINGKYRIVRLIGDGGMGSVFEAEHQVLGSHVALKFLHPEIARQPGLKERFLQEARVSATVQSPHICRVSDVDTADEGAYLVMELLRGEPLQALMDREPQLDVPRAVDLTLQVLSGLQAAHQQGVVHRDLKPDNVFLVPSHHGPQVKLLDFGIAKLRHSEEYQMTLTRPGAVMGTPEYMAPEQAYSSDLVDQRSDIYSLGVMLFEMLAGKRPAEGDNPQQIAEQIITGKSLKLADLRPDLPEALVALVSRAIQGNPDERLPSCAEFTQGLSPFAPYASGPFGTRSGAPARSSVGSRNLTGAATPFQPVSKTPVVTDAGVGSAKANGNIGGHDHRSVPQTLPPEDGAPPPASQLSPGTGISPNPPAKTDSMPVYPSIAGAPPQPTGVGFPPAGPQPAAYPAATPRRPKRRAGSGWIWALLFVLLVAGGALAGWQYYENYVRVMPTPPPLPTLRIKADTDEPAEIEFPDVEEPHSAESNWNAPTRRSPPAPRSNSPAPDPKLPTFTLPTNLPAIPIPTSLPPGIPTSLPEGFPTSFPFPMSPAPSPSE